MAYSTILSPDCFAKQTMIYDIFYPTKDSEGI